MLYQILASTIHGKIYKNNNFKVLSPTWNENFELPDGSYSVFEIQDYFKYFIKKHETVTDNNIRKQNRKCYYIWNKYRILS